MENQLAQLRREVFHGSPRIAVAMSEGVDWGDEGWWLRGVALGAHGRYGCALTVLAQIHSGSPWLSQSLSTSASLHRQLSRHAQARVLDLEALDAAVGVVDQGDAELGLAADAVGLGDQVEARSRWAKAVSSTEGDWRRSVRCSWVETEIALMNSDGLVARAAASAALTLSADRRAPRHVAKSMLFAGVAALQVQDVTSAARLLRSALAQAADSGAWPLVWPAATVLARIAPDSVVLRARAASVVTTIASGLPSEWRADWLASLAPVTSVAS
ncbi:MAG: hypothetical protein NTZ03_08940 [Actinobacteria bacterium]|nr:hypothetical protein [Actinomycetota bacterium]